MKRLAGLLNPTSIALTGGAVVIGTALAVRGYYGNQLEKALSENARLGQEVEQREQQVFQLIEEENACTFAVGAYVSAHPEAEREFNNMGLSDCGGRLTHWNPEIITNSAAQSRTYSIFMPSGTNAPRYSGARYYDLSSATNTLVARLGTRTTYSTFTNNPTESLAGGTNNDGLHYPTELQGSIIIDPKLVGKAGSLEL